MQTINDSTIIPVIYPKFAANILLFMTRLVITAVAPLRAEPSHRSEMTSQLLFGELVDDLESKGDFVRVKNRYDGYEGWCQRRQLAAMEESQFTYPTRYSQNTEDYVLVNGTKIILSPGSVCFGSGSGEVLKMGKYSFEFHLQDEKELGFSSPADAVVHYAKLFLGTPYLWGGRGRYGIDCSGLSQTAYKLAGKFLPRDSGPQSQEGEVVNLLQEARPGDLAFFDNDEGKIVHVGILLSANEIIHASASARIDPIDSYGIVHKEEGERTHKLRIIKRFF